MTCTPLTCRVILFTIYSKTNSTFVWTFYGDAKVLFFFFLNSQISLTFASNSIKFPTIRDVCKCVPAITGCSYTLLRSKVRQYTSPTPPSVSSGRLHQVNLILEAHCLTERRQIKSTQVSPFSTASSAAQLSPDGSMTMDRSSR